MTLEPTEAMAAAFNRKGCAVAIVLALGALWYLGCGADVDLL